MENSVCSASAALLLVSMHHRKCQLFETVCFSFIALTFFLTVGNGQTITGHISGTVKDTSNAVLPGATVAVTNVLVADGRLTVDAALESGQVTETVTVTAAAGETVNTTSGEIACVVDGEQVMDMALNGRNFLQLATLIPGAPLPGFDAIAQTTTGGDTISVNGSRADSNNFTVDGGFNLFKPDNSTTNNNVGVDFIQEVKIQTSNFSAKHGRQSGATINVTSRNGGNQLHGSVFEFLRTTSWTHATFSRPACGSCASTTSATASVARLSKLSSSSSAGRSGSTSGARSIRCGAACRRWPN